MTKSKKRFMKLAGMTASITGKVAKNSLKQLSRDEKKRHEARSQMMTDVGVQIADTLGEMKGAVMKVGQMASQYKDVFPAEIAQSLEKLQNNAPPMPFCIIKKQVETELGKPMDELFYEFEETAFASASIGQVHKAVLFDKEGGAGVQVVVKVQYPNVEENIDSDLKQVRLALKLAGVLNISKDLQTKMFAEISQNLRQELNYILEAKNLTTFYKFYADNDGIVIPTVFFSHSTQRVLTLSSELGESINTAKNWDNETKKKIATQLFHFSAGQLFDLQMLHCDPHPGNFAFRNDGSIVAYDFGSIRSYSDEEVGLFRRLLSFSIIKDIKGVEKTLIEMGIRKEDDVDIEHKFYEQWLDICLKPLSVISDKQAHVAKKEGFDFAVSDTHHEVISQMKQSLRYLKQFQPSATTMMVDRTLSGQYWNLVNLEVSIDFSELLTAYTTSLSASIEPPLTLP